MVDRLQRDIKTDTETKTGIDEWKHKHKHRHKHRNIHTKTQWRTNIQRHNDGPMNTFRIQKKRNERHSDRLTKQEQDNFFSMK